MSGVRKFRYGNRPHEGQKFVQGNLIKTAVDIWGGDGTIARRIHDAAYDYLYTAGPEFGEGLASKQKSSHGRRAYPYRNNKLRRRSNHRIRRQVSYRLRLHKKH